MTYDSIPENFVPLFEVVGCVCEVNGEILLLLRNKEKSEGGKWGIPGGKVDPGETLTEAMVREMKEETGHDMLPTDFRYMKKLYVEHPRHQFIYHLFFTALPGKPNVQLNSNEHQNFLWLTPENALTLNYVSDFDKCLHIVYT